MPHATPRALGKSQPIYLTSQIRELERAALAAEPQLRLMERAGEAAAELARTLIAESTAPVLVLAGPGNNGGDALVVARHLRRWWQQVDVVFTGEATELPPEAADALRQYLDAGGALLSEIPAHKRFDLVVDGLFGIGLSRAVEGEYVPLIERVNTLGAPVLALDVPSGLASDTGAIMGTAVRADHTITFFGYKPGLLTLDGPDCCGQTHVHSLGLNPTQLLAPRAQALGTQSVTPLLPPRPRNSHKGSYGTVGVIGGAEGMVGAALLAARAALKMGAGRVLAGCIAPEAPAVDPAQPELMRRAPAALLKDETLTAAVVGPGLGQSEAALILMQRALQSGLPLVLDADALNLIAASADLQKRLSERVAPAVLTPHPAEAARLLAGSTADIQRDRLEAAHRLAMRYRCSVVLKGAGSICVLRDGAWFINVSGNPGLASAGMGDVLSGMIGAFLAQGLSADHALLLGVHLHGAAADACVQSGLGPVGLSASEVTDQARRLLNTWIYGNECRVG
jgi:ADP-dependent NAD(P)H-hydrate dehydratase / NAD(P)H-hydrate epimerase